MKQHTVFLVKMILVQGTWVLVMTNWQNWSRIGGLVVPGYICLGYIVS